MAEIFGTPGGIWLRMELELDRDGFEAYVVTNEGGDQIAEFSFEEHAREFCERMVRSQTWFDNGIQFPRLIAEINATQDSLDIEALAESMDLEVSDVNELFDRANRAWEIAKEKTNRIPPHDPNAVEVKRLGM
jgi:hypothetical protein